MIEKVYRGLCNFEGAVHNVINYYDSYSPRLETHLVSHVLIKQPLQPIDPAV